MLAKENIKSSIHDFQLCFSMEESKKKKPKLAFRLDFWQPGQKRGGGLQYLFGGFRHFNQFGPA